MMKLKESRDAGLEGPEIREVILGAQMTGSNVTALLQCRELMKPYCDFSIWESKIEVALRRIHHEPYALGLCPTCRGAGKTKMDH